MKTELFKMMWQFVKQTGFSKSEALKMAWRNLKLKKELQNGIVRFHFQKVDGSIREAWGTLKTNLIPNINAANINAANNRAQNATIQVYFDTEKKEWRSFKKLNLVTV